MAGVLGVALNAAEVASGPAVKTILQLRSPSLHTVKILGWGIFFQGTSVTADPVLVQPCLQDGAGTMSALAAGTNLNKLDPSSVALTCTGGHTATVEPTTNTPLGSFYIHPQSGYEVRYPLGQEPRIFSNSTLGNFGIRVTAATTVDCVCTIYFEE